MNRFIISCNLTKPEYDYTNLYKEIQKYTSHNCFDSTWLINTNKTIEQIEEHIISTIDPSDSLVICKIEKPIHGSLSNLQWDWIKENL